MKKKIIIITVIILGIFVTTIIAIRTNILEKNTVETSSSTTLSNEKICWKIKIKS